MYPCHAAELVKGGCVCCGAILLVVLLVVVELVEAVDVAVVAELITSVVVFAFWSGPCTAGLNPAIRLNGYPGVETREKLTRRLRTKSNKALTQRR
jgi:hypothetical protein